MPMLVLLSCCSSFFFSVSCCSGLLFALWPLSSILPFIVVVFMILLSCFSTQLQQTLHHCRHRCSRCHHPHNNRDHHHLISCVLHAAKPKSKKGTAAVAFLFSYVFMVICRGVSRTLFPFNINTKCVGASGIWVVLARPEPFQTEEYETLSNKLQNWQHSSKDRRKKLVLVTSVFEWFHWM